jgi:surfactin synthase thioesterase subunit
MTLPGTESSRWLCRYRPAPQARVRLVCFPHAGGSASYFYPVAQALAADIDVIAVQYPGRQNRRLEPCCDSISELADQVGRELRAEPAPIAFFGHSMGAIVAFEVARRMERGTGTGPAALFASGRRAPSRSRAENVHERDDAGLVAEILALGGTDSALLQDRELLSMVLPAIRADYRAIERYSCPPGVTISSPVTVLTGTADPRTTQPEAEAWRGHTTGRFSLHSYPGGHFFLQSHIPEILAVITAGLDRL